MHEDIHISLKGVYIRFTGENTFNCIQLALITMIFNSYLSECTKNSYVFLQTLEIK